MSHYRIKLDRSASSVVVTCTCGWRDLALEPLQAQRIAASHEASCHPGQVSARKMLAEATRRLSR